MTSCKGSTLIMRKSARKSLCTIIRLFELVFVVIQFDGQTSLSKIPGQCSCLSDMFFPAKVE